MKSPKKVVVIGLDAAVPKVLFKLAMEGILPNFAKLINEGVYAENCLVPYPTITPPNWTTIATGSWPGTHGITCFHIHKIGDPLDRIICAFNTEDCRSEYIWDAAERDGKKSILFNWPSSWPPTIKKGIQIGGMGLYINEWRLGYEGERFSQTLAASQLFSIEEYPFATQVEPAKAHGWKGLSLKEGDLEAPLKFTYRLAKDDVLEEKIWHLLIQDRNGKGYDTATLAKAKSAKDVACSLKVSEWSDPIYERFQTSDGVKDVVFRAKLIELSRDAKKLRLFFTPLAQMNGWAYPQEVADKIRENVKEGQPFPTPDFEFLWEWIDFDTCMETVEFKNKWMAETIFYLLRNYEWDFFFMHNHDPDTFYHMRADVDPAICEDKEESAMWTDAERRVYESLDRMTGRILNSVDEKDTLVIVTNDHGAKATTGAVGAYHMPSPVKKILKDTGLLAFKDDEMTEIDWLRTKAIPQRMCYIYVNVKGRDPNGIVEAGEEYERVRDEIIRALYNYTDPQTGEKSILFALKKEDARILGLYGDRVGDIVYAVNPHSCSYQHGDTLSTTVYGSGSLRGLLIMKGPGVKKGCILQRNVWLTDLVPTICYLTDTPVPKDVEGAIIYQALEDPDIKLKELRNLRKNYERMKKAFYAGRARAGISP